jgi:hypothetical protein
VSAGRSAQEAGPAAVRPSAGTISAVPEPVDESGEINYDLALMLDAEDLPEQGILQAYQQIALRLAEYGVAAGPVVENADSLANHYSVDFDGHRYVVDGQYAWGLAAHALFDIVNRQLASADVRFYVINGGNDPFGIFMTAEQAERARHALPRKSARCRATGRPGRSSTSSTLSPAAATAVPAPARVIFQRRCMLRSLFAGGDPSPTPISMTCHPRPECPF